ncbi:MAG: CDP-alcohol phosphatidyltransferase family protein [Candidatus Omnitrophica bacterium]|nr:CDP-alcohol phosphatidyltransferase family protein [Candidatus Omnitrophota bacterium]MDD5441246.1 CDP-alcohol phosphatidyltransferase family protein [Candidatus Omnitrophota bacterium]
MFKNICNNKISLADKITLIRVLLIPLFILLIRNAVFYQNFRWYALIVFILAVLTDFFDGFVARLRKESSGIGEMLDPIADKLLLISAFLSLYFFYNTYGTLRLWVILIIFLRDFCLLVFVSVFLLFKYEIKIKPSFLGKATTFLQMLTVIWFLSGFIYFEYVCYITVATTVISGIDYFFKKVRFVNE